MLKISDRSPQDTMPSQRKAEQTEQLLGEVPGHIDYSPVKPPTSPAPALSVSTVGNNGYLQINVTAFPAEVDPESTDVTLVNSALVMGTSDFEQFCVQGLRICGALHFAQQLEDEANENAQ